MNSCSCFFSPLLLTSSGLVVDQRANCCQATTSPQSATFQGISCVEMGSVCRVAGSVTDCPTASTGAMKKTVVSI